MALRSGYQGIKKVTDNLILSLEGTLDVNVSDEILEDDPHPVSGGAVDDALDDKLDTYASDPTQWDTTPTASSTKPVTSGGEYNTTLGGYQLVKDTVGWSGKNLWREPFTAQFIDGSGDISDNSAMKLTDYINIGDITELYAVWASKTGTVTVRINSYTSAKVFISRITSADNKHVFTLPANTKYVRINIENSANNYLNDFMVCDNRLVDKSYEEGHAPVSQAKADNSVIAPVEDGTNASQAYALGSHFIRNGKFCTVTTAMAQGDAVAGKYVEGQLGDFIVRRYSKTPSIAADGYIELSIPTITDYTIISVTAAPAGTGSAVSCDVLVRFSTLTSVIVRNSDSEAHTWPIYITVIYAKNVNDYETLT